MEGKRRVVGANRQASLAFSDELLDDNLDIDCLGNFDLDANVVTNMGRKSMKSMSRRRSSVGMLAGNVNILSDVEQSRIADMYRTVIQMSSENKLNEKNSWNFDLIDHMGSILKDEKKGVNFQKASCTLDASVKIYSNRVDDTYATSHRILESLTRNGPVEEASEENSGSDGKPKAKVGSKASSARLNIASTIEKDPERNLNATKLEHEYSFDPMFQKMSKAFDEGGAKGMLLYNMRVTPLSGSLSFQEKRIEDRWMEQEKISMQKAKPIAIDIKDLVSRSGLTFDTIKTLSIAPKLSEYRKVLGISETKSCAIPNTVESVADLAANNLPTASQLTTETILSVQQQHEPATMTESYPTDDFGGDYGDYDDYQENDDVDAPNYDVDEDLIPAKQSLMPPSNVDSQPTKIRWSITGDDHGRDEIEIQTLTKALDNIQIDSTNEYAYFDVGELQQKGNSWAGAKHWNYSTRSKVKVTETSTAETPAEIEEAKPKTAPTKKSKKGELGIKFTLDLIDESEFGVKENSKTDSTVMTKAALEKAALEHKELLLPVDENLNVRDLCRLFLLPNVVVPPKNFTLNLKQTKTLGDGYSRAQYLRDNLINGNQQEILWTENQLNPQLPPSASNNTSDNDNNNYEDVNNYDDGGGYDDGDYGDHLADGSSFNNPTAAATTTETQQPKPKLEGLNIDQSNLVQATRTVEKIEINYAKVSKRVNVHKLKGEIWSEIKETLEPPIDVPKSKERKSEAVPDSSLSFQDLVQDLSASPQQKDVSIPYYFICLLHLANENSLKISDKEDLSDLVISFD